MSRMLRMLSLCATLLVLLLSGCQGALDPARYTGPFWKPISLNPTKAAVYVYELSPHQYQRPGPRRTAKYKWPLYIDGRYRGVLKPNTLLRYELSPGQHTFRVKINREEGLAAVNKAAQVVVNVAAGQMIFLKFDQRQSLKL